MDTKKMLPPAKSKGKKTGAPKTKGSARGENLKKGAGMKPLPRKNPYA